MIIGGKVGPWRVSDGDRSDVDRSFEGTRKSIVQVETQYFHNNDFKRDYAPFPFSEEN